MLIRQMLLGISLLIFCGISPLSAQDNTTQPLPVKWSLQECLNYSVKNNFELNTLRLSKRTSEQNLLLSKAALLPGVYGSTTQSLTHKKADPLEGGNQSQVVFTSNFNINSSWTIYNGGYLKDDIRQKELLQESANLNIAQQENDNTLLITQAYLNIFLAKENIVYIKDLLKTSNAQLDLGDKQFSAGSIARKNLVELQAQFAADKYNLVTANNQERQNILTLKQLLLLPSEVPFDIMESDTLVATALVPSLGEVQKKALETRPEVKNGELGVQIADLNLSKARSGYLPVVSLGAVVATGYSDNQSDAYTKQLDNNFYQQIGLTLSVPIFSKRLNKTNVQKSKIEVEQANLSLENTKTVLSQIVEQAYINVLNAQAQYDAAVEQMKASQESYRISTEELRLGAVNIVEMLVQKNLYVQTLQAYISAKYNAAMNIRIYDFYNGKAIKI